MSGILRATKRVVNKVVHHAGSVLLVAAVILTLVSVLLVSTADDRQPVVSLAWRYKHISVAVVLSLCLRATAGLFSHNAVKLLMQQLQQQFATLVPRVCLQQLLFSAQQDHLVCTIITKQQCVHWT